MSIPDTAGSAAVTAAARTPRPARRFTVLLPVVRPPDLLPFAVRSVLKQSERDFELCILCDGAPAETEACAQALASEDGRIRVFAFDKGARNGEAHRDAILTGSQAQFVAQIADDDLWFPDHLSCLARCLRRADFASMRQVRVETGRELRSLPGFGHLRYEPTRRRMLTEVWNFFGPTEAGYRLEAYRGLPVGWSPAPADIFSDLFMWRKFLRQPGLRLASAQDITSLKFPAQKWGERPMSERIAVTEEFSARLSDPAELAKLRDQARKAARKELHRRELQILLRYDPAVAALPLLAKALRRLGLTRKPAKV